MTGNKTIILELTIRYMQKNKKRTMAVIAGIIGTMIILTVVNIFAGSIMGMMSFESVSEEELQSMVNAVLVILMLMGCVMIYNAYAISVFEKLKFLGMLGSTGATRLQKAGIIYLEGMIEGSLGIPFGIGAGVVLAKLLLKAIQNILLYEKAIPMYLTAEMIIKIAVFGFGMIGLACLIPAWKAAKTSSIDLITNQIQIEKKMLDGTNLLQDKNLFGTTWTLAVRNIWVRRKNYITNGILLIITFCLILDGVAAMRGINGEYAPRDDREREKLELWTELYTNNVDKIEAFYQKVKELPEVKDISLVRTLDLDGMLLSKEQLQEDIQDYHDSFGIRDAVGFFKSHVTVMDAKTGKEVIGYWVWPKIVGLDEDTFQEYLEKSGYEFSSENFDEKSGQYPVLVEDYVTISRNGKEERRSILNLGADEEFTFRYSRYGDMHGLAIFEGAGKNSFDEILNGKFQLIGTTKEAVPYPYYSGTTEDIDGYQDITLGVMNMYMPMRFFNKLLEDPAFSDTYGEHPEDTVAFNSVYYKSIITNIKFSIERENVKSSVGFWERIFKYKALEKQMQEDRCIEEKIREIAVETGLKNANAADVEQLVFDGAILPENDTYYFGSRAIVQREKYFHSEKYLLLLLGYGLIALITMLSLTNIFQNISQSMRMRKREFAALQSIGMTVKDLRKMLLFENAMYGVIGCVIGIPISFLLLQEVRHEFSKWNEINWVTPWDMVPLQIFIAILLVVLPMLHTVFQMKNMNLIEEIRNENR